MIQQLMCKKNMETAEIFRRISVRSASVMKYCYLKRQEWDKHVQERRVSEDLAIRDSAGSGRED